MTNATELVMVRHQHDRHPRPVAASVVIEMANDLLASQIMRDYYKHHGESMPDDWTLPDELVFKEFHDAMEFLNYNGDVEVFDPTRFSVDDWHARRDPMLEHAQRVYDHDRDFEGEFS